MIESLERQKYNRPSDFSPEWITFGFYENARAAKQIGYGHYPIAFYEELLMSN